MPSKNKIPQTTSTIISIVKGGIWRVNVATLSFPQRFVIRALRIIHAVICDLREGQLNLMAMSLVYTTIISLVPLLALSFSVLKGFGAHNQIRPMLLDAFAPLGDKGVEVADKIIEFVDNIQVGVLGALGLALLIYSVVAMMQKIERAFNYTWHVSKGRTFAERFSDYLSVLLVGPLLIFLSVGITASMRTSEVNDMLSQLPFMGHILEFLGMIVPYLMMAFAFGFIYFFIPNTRVHFLSAFMGGLVTAVIWKIMGWFFSIFVANSASHAAIYSAFATLIVFMVWLYLAWLVLLVGASIAFYHQKNPKSLLIRQDHLDLSNEDKENLGISLIYIIAKNFVAGKPPTTNHHIADELGVPDKVVSHLINILEREKIILHADTDKGGYVPARALTSITVADVVKALRSAGDITINFEQSPQIKRQINKVQNQFDKTLTQLKKINLDQLVS